MPNKTFPPRFDQSIPYPAELHLDALDMEGAPVGDISLGTYFDIEFPGFGVNQKPSLSYGKHAFKVTIKPDPSGLLYPDEETEELYPVENPLPKLRPKSRVIFECKDSVGTIIFSDITPIHGSDSLQFTGYLWIKEDPLRTYDSIQEGNGRLYIVGQTLSNDKNWLTKFNIRSFIDINVNLTINTTNDDGTTQSSFIDNTSPIIFKKLSKIQSGSGLTITENIIDNTAGNERSTLVISASNLQTYSGKINNVQLQYWLSGSGDLSSDNWKNFSPALNYILKGSVFEEGIDSKYSQGINPVSEEWYHEISFSDVPHGQTNKVKIKLNFFDIDGNPAIDVVPVSGSTSNPGEVQIYYPGQNPLSSNYDDTDGVQWLEMEGSGVTLTGYTVFNANNPIVLETGAGQFNFGDGVFSAPSRGGQKFGPDGNPLPTDNDYYNNPT